MPPNSQGSFVQRLRRSVPDLMLVNPQVSLVSRDGRFLSHPMGLFETVPQALAALRTESGAAGSAEPGFEGIFAYAEPARGFHTIDFTYRAQGAAGSVFQEPDEGQRWVLRACADGSGCPLREHPDLGARVYPEPFYRYIRSRIGTDWILAIGATALVMDDDGRMLLQRRRDDGSWAHPGGCLEPGERIGEAVVREVEEETGYRVGGAVLAGVLTGPECVVTYPNGDRLRYLDFIFTARVIGGALRPESEETIDVGWFDPPALPAGTMDITRRHVARLLGSWGRFSIE
jgi:8-oxo-dGTP pyrophosphatase MutT (NUDIX family)